MNNKSYNPENWLTNLNKAIFSTLCRENKQTISLDDGLKKAGELIQDNIKDNASTWWAGNGGSASICAHLSQDMLNRLKAKSFFMGDTSLISCMSNDFGYSNVYSRPLETLAQKGDLLIAISSSGNSDNIISCINTALKKNMNIITLTGLDDANKIWNMSNNISFFVPADLYGLVEVGHEAILHSIIETLWLNNC